MKENTKQMCFRGSSTGKRPLPHFISMASDNVPVGRRDLHARNLLRHRD
ncbi:MAG: hypothetical protein JETT_0047 [Candidatus Jettenia ecosi]|uniref:Uncharacterized protein n=1 Tax=Candidatus Jettenia ecosi TaxID=2494326 RepID=A0A533QFP9_9BACT|nr:MAG: hypothetical protein JETT_0047 [Candidatus Jettenia ecosi]